MARRTPPAADDSGVGDDAGETDADDTIGPGEVSFACDIRPIIQRTRDVSMAQMIGRGGVPCHDGKASSHPGLDLSGFDVSTLAALRRGGGSSGTRIIIPGKPAESVIVQVLKGTYFYAAKMPKGSTPWSADDIRTLEDWIAQGAKGKRDE